ncbi:hypothetical protein JOC85_000460 [Bacillus mesophilus]|uniref:UGSC-like domain-containing protein n=3 Tax=Bacillus mesophilus TaxID=1808955 RepID=A0A6M0Q461_9BACI|nr:hypothetical protein [Bacillus mesophilus]NEY70559.1 hypothetical protein [Bacillus mesophilus]
MEKLGVPTAVVSTLPFITSSRAMAVAQGIPDYPFITIPHPIAATEKHVLQSWVDEIIEEVEDVLVSGTSKNR